RMRAGRTGLSAGGAAIAWPRRLRPHALPVLEARTGWAAIRERADGAIAGANRPAICTAIIIAIGAAGAGVGHAGAPGRVYRAVEVVVGRAAVGRRSDREAALADGPRDRRLNRRNPGGRLCARGLGAGAAIPRRARRAGAASIVRRDHASQAGDRPRVELLRR